MPRTGSVLRLISAASRRTHYGKQGNNRQEKNFLFVQEVFLPSTIRTVYTSFSKVFNDGMALESSFWFIQGSILHLS